MLARLARKSNAASGDGSAAQMDRLFRGGLLALGTFMLALLASCGPPKGLEASEVLKDIPKYAGKRVAIRTKLKSGARCRQQSKDWQTYCTDCQYCRGPVVVDVGIDLPAEGLDDWPMILGGTYDGQDIRCKGPLNQVECFPFKEGITYIVEGKIEAQRPPKLLVERFWTVEGT